jgi:hypothetical protein
MIVSISTVIPKYMFNETNPQNVARPHSKLLPLVNICFVADFICLLYQFTHKKDLWPGGTGCNGGVGCMEELELLAELDAWGNWMY